jgi:antitoxin VapB
MGNRVSKQPEVDKEDSLAYAEPMPKQLQASRERRVKLFKNGRNQAIRIPREFELPGEELILHKDGNRLILEPSGHKSLLAVLAELRPLREEFPPMQDLPPDPVKL